MIIRRIVNSVRLPMAALIFAFLVMNPAKSLAACSPNAAAPQKIADFLLNPASLLNGPGGSRDENSIISDVRDLVISDPTTLTALINLLKSGALKVEQQQAVGTGLGLAANICLVPDPKFAGEIAPLLADTPSEEAKLKFAAVTGNKPIGAVAGGGLGGGPSGGASGGQTSPLGSLGGSASTLQPFLANSVSNSPSNYFTSSVGGLSSSFTSTTSVTSVSP